MSIARIVAFSLGLMLAGAQAWALDSSQGKLQVERVMRGLDEPWSLTFLPGGGFMVTERDGRLYHVQNGQAQPVAGLPALRAFGQGGLLDVVAARDFAQSRVIFLSYARPVGDAVGTAVARATLSGDGTRLENLQTIFSMLNPSEAGQHFGGRIVQDAQGLIYLTIGDRGENTQAQDLMNHAGTVIRINPDGSIPSDNPFVGRADALPEIWSYGHRNPQGAALDARGQLWVNEHGARGGDEINLVQKGANYGWPVIAYGRNYNGTRIGEGTAKDGMEQPDHYWDPSIAPSGMMIYSGKLWPEWRGHHFVGSLKFDYIAVLDPDADFAEEPLQSRHTGRVRDIREAPDGSIWFLSVDNGALYRITPGG